MKSHIFIRFALAIFLLGFSYMSVWYHLVIYAEEEGLSSYEASSALSLAGLSSAVGRVVAGLLGDRIGHLMVFKLSFVGIGVMTCLWVLAQSLESILVFAILFGFFSGSMVSIMPVAVAERYGAARLSTVLGMLCVFLAPGYVCGPYLVGLAFDYFGNYIVAAEISGGIALAAALILITIPSQPSKIDNDPLIRHENPEAAPLAKVSPPVK
eukprot:TRINITY_DN8772_c0_g1_i1.p2 TRINITY_DN8772_c0_g1~~TRINITY_DN8772_c0_g1_i1.p2  ORF type:complete len:211 (-),score=22.60 TRINITY_DN8772_c0_g1_i1:18-650(-)